MKTYKVKLDKVNQARPDQKYKGYLGFNTRKHKEVLEYSRGEAIKKARMFGGKIEESEAIEATPKKVWILTDCNGDNICALSDGFEKKLLRQLAQQFYCADSIRLLGYKNCFSGTFHIEVTERNKARSHEVCLTDLTLH